jgi:uncharacterized protein YjbJ (UPF0337 family)
MKNSTKNRVRGNARQLKGKAKEAIGRGRGNPRQEEEGLDDQIIGKVQNVAGRIQKKLGD